MHAVLKPTVDFELEWHLSARWAIVALLLAAVVMLVASDDVLDLGRRARMDLLGALLYPLSGIAWLLESWKPRVGRAATTVLLIVVVVAIRGWLGVPGTLVLLSVSTGAAVAMLGPAAAVLAAVGESGLLLLLSHAAKAAVPSTTDVPSALRAGLASVDGTEISVALVVVWSSLAVAYAVYYPLSQLNRRLWESLRQARGRMDESLDRKVELAQALEDLGNANRQLALANERSAALRTVAEEAQRSKAAFVARVSHEFRTPLNMIIGLVGIMVENPEMYAEELPPDLWADLEIVYRNCQHLSGMINDVLDLTQAEAGRLVLHKEQVDLGAIVESAIAVVWPMIDKKRLALQVSVPDDLPQVYCDPNRVRQVLLNLLSNAARFTAQGGIRSCGPT